MPSKKVMVVFGTRPEAIKMAPVVRALRETPGIETVVAVTAQHRQMLDQVLDLFDISPDDDLDLMEANQGLPDLYARILTGISAVIARRKPDLLLVHGDTSTTLAAAMAAFLARVPVGHVEAGLRTGNMDSPWPEEMNRRLVTPLARLHFAPTPSARDNLLAEGVNRNNIHVTGNTVVDALLHSVARIESDKTFESRLNSQLPDISPKRHLILVTGHRRESFGAGFENICYALNQISQIDGVDIVYPVHLNPNVQEPVNRILRRRPNIHLIQPLDYLPFLQLMRRASLIITDSGGVQEEAPSLGKPVLVMRNVSERHETLKTGTSQLVGTNPERIYRACMQLLRTPKREEATDRKNNPYGDGKAAQSIAGVIKHWMQTPPPPNNAGTRTGEQG